MPMRLIASCFFALALFLLSADLVHVVVAGNKVKYGYFVVLALWLFEPARMLASAREAVARLPRFVFVPVVPLLVSVALSANRLNSVLWTLWLCFDLFTVLTVYAFLKTQRFSPYRIQQCVAAALGLAALFGLVQFVAIYGFDQVIFGPQLHFDVYRINGLAGWPIFLNIFCFLLLPIVLLQERLSIATGVLLAIVVFVLVQSTAKTGWVLFVVLGVMLAVIARRLFVHRYLALLVPMVVVALLLPTPSIRDDVPFMRGTDKVAKFSADLDLSNRLDSGTDRLLINQLGLNVFLEHPWFGVGPKAYRTYIMERFDQELPGVSKVDATGRPIVKNENIWLELLAEAGGLFTLGFICVLAYALWTPGFRFANRLHLGAWIALVLYFTISGQFSQTGLLTLVYAVFGVFMYGRELRAAQAESSRGIDTQTRHADPPSRMRPA